MTRFQAIKTWFFANKTWITLQNGQTEPIMRIFTPKLRQRLPDTRKNEPVLSALLHLLMDRAVTSGRHRIFYRDMFLGRSYQYVPFTIKFNDAGIIDLEEPPPPVARGNREP